uniref:Uncharacterized protein n=1 Tax=Rhizophora mucronata TaxID=61149 RepID=A0A2P2PU10_RHIMU
MFQQYAISFWFNFLFPLGQLCYLFNRLTIANLLSMLI